MFDQLDLGAIATVTAAVIAVVAAGVGYVVRNNNERNRLLNIALFQLLEIRGLLRIIPQLKPESLLEVYFRVIQKYIPTVSFTEEDRAQTAQMLEGSWKFLLTMIFQSADRRIEESFRTSILKLAEVDPLLAFRLKSNGSLNNLIGNLDQWSMQVQNDMKDQTDDQQLQIYLKGILQGAKDFVYRDVISDIEKDLMWLSFQTSVVMFFRMIYRIFIKERRAICVLENTIDVFVRRVILPQMRSAIAAQ